MVTKALKPMMQSILEKYYGKSPAHMDDTIHFLSELVTQIRPTKPHNIEYSINAIQSLCYVLNSQQQYADYLRDVLLTLITTRKPVSIFADSGIQPGTGFFSEMSRRIGHKLLPQVVDKNYLKDVFGLIFCEKYDDEWVIAVPNEIWLQLFAALHFELTNAALIDSVYKALLESAQVLSYRLSALGLEPELIRNHEDLENYSSPFITQNLEVAELVNKEKLTLEDAKHSFVIFDQCRQVIIKVRKNSAQTGTSIDLTFLMQRMTQQLDRLEHLLNILVGIKNKTAVDGDVLSLFKTLTYAEANKNNVTQHFSQNVELLALRVTENASKTGEHYITTTRSEYFQLMRSAMGAGFIVAFMAAIKIIISKQHFAPLNEAICFSLNYGIGFVLIHTLHFTVATKQPAMTAASIAESIDSGDGKTRDLHRLVSIVAQTVRSQTVAIFGNVVFAIPFAMLIAWSVHHFTGQPFIDADKAHRLLHDIDVLHTPALFYAAIAGICLFLSGLIAGYHDNLAIYNRIPQRLAALKWLQKILGEARLNRVATYIENNLGAIAGNFYFGCMLGGMTAVGVLFGVPVDIRHITFSSAFAGFSSVALDFNMSTEMIWLAASGVLLIGIVNLLVSFSLAIYVAMKSRKLSFAQWRTFLKNLLSRLNQHPAEFFLPPKREIEALEKD
ncbi:MAG: site-specific recombinase [Methylophilaceae bacterium]|nr:site-specific recombinase [Methylophilaceae bacterium]